MAIFFCIFLPSRYRNSTPETARMCTYFMAKQIVKADTRNPLRYLLVTSWQLCCHFSKSLNSYWNKHVPPTAFASLRSGGLAWEVKKESGIFHPLLPKHVSNAKSLKTPVKFWIPTCSNTCIMISIIFMPPRPDSLCHTDFLFSLFSMKPLLIGHIITQ